MGRSVAWVDGAHLGARILAPEGQLTSPALVSGTGAQSVWQASADYTPGLLRSLEVATLPVSQPETQATEHSWKQKEAKIQSTLETLLHNSESNLLPGPS